MSDGRCGDNRRGEPPRLQTEMNVKIKNRKVELCQIAVPMIGKSLRIIHVTPKQHEKLNAMPVGKEVFLSQYYCQIGGDFWVIRTNDGLQYVPNPYSLSDGDVCLDLGTTVNSRCHCLLTAATAGRVVA
jgi:hypothetical protein